MIWKRKQKVISFIEHFSKPLRIWDKRWCVTYTWHFEKLVEKLNLFIGYDDCSYSEKETEPIN